MLVDESCTLHCFRRGACQHYFIHSEKKWPLNVVKAWGGWAGTEGVTTLINYLLNEFEGIENNHSDQHCPWKRDRNYSSLENNSNIGNVAKTEQLIKQVDSFLLNGVNT